MKRIRKCPLEDRKPDQAADQEDSEPKKAVEPAGEPVKSKENPAESGEKENQFCFLKGIVDCSSGRIQDCNMKRTRICPLEENIQETARKAAESKKRQQEAEARKKQKEAETKEAARKKREKAEAEANAVRKEEINEGKTAGGQGHSQSFCFLKGLVDCMPCDVQDCNMKRVKKCPLD